MRRNRRLAVFPKVDAASPRGLMAPPGLRPWAPRVQSGIGSAFRTGSPGSALGSYVVSLCAYPAWDTQVSRSWPLACPIRGLPFSRLTDWGGTAPCGANINAACRRRPPLVADATTFLLKGSMSLDSQSPTAPYESSSFATPAVRWGGKRKAP